MLTLTLAIGANSAIFTVVNGVLIQPLAYRESDRVVVIYSTFPALGLPPEERGFRTVSPAEYRELQQRSRAFSAMGAWNIGEISLSGIDTPLAVTAANASAEVFSVLGVSPQLGRVYTRDEETRAGQQVAVISDRLWRGAFGADAAIIGKRVDVDDQRREVIGVMPPGFDIADSDVDVWKPAAIPEQPTNRGGHSLHVVARLTPGVTLESARSDVARQLAAWGELNPGEHVPKKPRSSHCGERSPMGTGRQRPSRAVDPVRGCRSGLAHRLRQRRQSAAGKGGGEANERLQSVRR